MWTVTRMGSVVNVVDKHGTPVAEVGSSDDYRINRKLTHAELIAAAPEMLEVLIDLKTLLKHEYFVEDHPILDSIAERCAELIDRSMKTHGEQHEHKLRNRDSGYFRQSSGGRVGTQTADKILDEESGRLDPYGFAESNATYERTSEIFNDGPQRQ